MADEIYLCKCAQYSGVILLNAILKGICTKVSLFL